jgi:hypothetical protein
MWDASPESIVSSPSDVEPTVKAPQFGNEHIQPACFASLVLVDFVKLSLFLFAIEPLKKIFVRKIMRTRPNISRPFSFKNSRFDNYWYAGVFGFLMDI